MASAKRQHTAHQKARPAPQACERCGSSLVQPVDWEEATEETWHVWLRCPECEHVRDDVFSQRELDDFDAHLDAGAGELTTTYRRLSRSNLIGEIEAFAAALWADAILPEDF